MRLLNLFQGFYTPWFQSQSPNLNLGMVIILDLELYTDRRPGVMLAKIGKFGC